MAQYVAYAKKYFSFIAAALTLLAACFSLAYAPDLRTGVSAWGLPFRAVVQWLLFPVILAALWLCETFVENFAKLYARIGYILAGAVQIISVCFLSTAASAALSEKLSGTMRGAGELPQTVGAGFILLLLIAAAVLVVNGVLLVQNLTRAKSIIKIAPTSGQNPFDFSQYAPKA